MRTSKFTDSQILSILKEYESGQTAKELSRKYGFHYQTLHVDFMSDAIFNSRRFRTLNIIDDYNREVSG